MYERKNKRYLYQIIEMYLKNKIDANSFCDEFYFCYDLEIDRPSLTNFEKEVFKELSFVVDRFCSSEEDLKKYPNVYFSEKELKQKTIETKQKLKNVEFYIEDLKEILECSKDELLKAKIAIFLVAVNDWPEDIFSLEHYEQAAKKFLGIELEKTSIEDRLNHINFIEYARQAESLAGLLSIFQYYPPKTTLKEIIEDIRKSKSIFYST